MLSIEISEKLIGSCVKVISNFKDKKLHTRDDFNIFRILRLTSNEVRTHSAFLAELLSSDGKHLMNNLFLVYFLEAINYTGDFKTDNYKVTIEAPIGQIDSDYETGGRIDILLSDHKGNQIIIENKIFAGDQEKQLKRYYNYNPTAQIVYLTIDGKEPSPLSLGDLDKKLIRCISYRYHIIDWLNKCSPVINSVPQVNFVIEQYRNLIKHLTNTSLNFEMNNEIQALMLSSKENLEASKSISDAFGQLNWLMRNEFNRAVLNKNKHLYFKQNVGDYTFQVIQEEDSDGFFIGVQVLYKGKVGKNNNQTLNMISLLIKSKFPDTCTNDNYIAWITPLGPLTKYEDLSLEHRYKLRTDIVFLENTTDRIYQQAESFILSTKELIEKYSNNLIL